MITQREIQNAFLRAAYAESIDPGLSIAWFGAGAVARRIASALDEIDLSRVDAIYDDAPDAESPIDDVPVRLPSSDAPPAQLLLATDTHAPALRSRAIELWGDRVRTIDLFDPSHDSWMDPGDGPEGFARTHPEQWREAVGLAQFRLERRAGPIDPAHRWRLAHSLVAGHDPPLELRADEPDRLKAISHLPPTGRIITLVAGAPIEDDPDWSSILKEHHTALSPDGRHAAIVWAQRDTFPVCPLRTGNALWIPHEPTNILDSLYGPEGAGAKRYTVRFDNGRTHTVTATRERTHADIRGHAELSRYETFADAIPSGARVLDCASGTGPGAAMLAAQGFQVTGAEIDEAAVAFASDRYPEATFVRADATSLPFPDHAFDAVVSVETIEHLPDPGAALREFSRVLRPDGLLCLTTPDENACDSPFHAVELSAADLRSAIDGVFGSGGWTGEPVGGAEGWHALIIRRREPAHL